MMNRISIAVACITGLAACGGQEEPNSLMQALTSESQAQLIVSATDWSQIASSPSAMPGHDGCPNMGTTDGSASIGVAATLIFGEQSVDVRAITVAPQGTDTAPRVVVLAGDRTFALVPAGYQPPARRGPFGGGAPQGTPMDLTLDVGNGPESAGAYLLIERPAGR